MRITIATRVERVLTVTRKSLWFKLGPHACGHGTTVFSGTGTRFCPFGPMERSWLPI